MGHTCLVRRLRTRALGDGGFTLIEMMVALILIGIIASSFLSVTVSSIQAARGNEHRTQAVQLAQDRLEQIVAQPWSNIGLYSSDPGYAATGNGGESTVTLTKTPRDPSVPTPEDSTTLAGVTYTVDNAITWADDPSDGSGALDSDGNTNDVKHVGVTVHWTVNGKALKVAVDDLRAATATEVPPSSGKGGLTVTVAGPDSATLNGSGNLVNPMTITATTSKVATTAALTFATRTGKQTIAIPVTNGTTWSVQVPLGTGPFDTGPTSFSVAVTSTSFGGASGTVKIPLVIGAAGTSLSVTAAPTQQLNTGNVLSQPIAITATGASTITAATVSYQTNAGTVVRPMTGSGTNWTYQVPADTTVFAPGQETFTISATFASATSATGLTTITLYDAASLPDVTGLVVKDPYSSSGLQSFCVSSNQYTLFQSTPVDVTVRNVAKTDTVKLTAPGLTTQEFPMTWVQTNADGSMVFRYIAQTGTQFPSDPSITLKAYAVKTIAGNVYRDDYVTDPAPMIEVEKRSSSCL